MPFTQVALTMWLRVTVEVEKRTSRAIRFRQVQPAFISSLELSCRIVSASTHVLHRTALLRRIGVARTRRWQRRVPRRNMKYLTTNSPSRPGNCANLQARQVTSWKVVSDPALALTTWYSLLQFGHMNETKVGGPRPAMCAYCRFPLFGSLFWRNAFPDLARVKL